jgi:hypothetical protein
MDSMALAGDWVQAWTEMVRLGPDLHGHDRWDEALEVGHLAMTRIRTNVERLVQLLQEHGYVFEAPAVRLRG